MSCTRIEDVSTNKYKPIEITNQSLQEEESNRIDPVCGKEVVWHIHLHEGFRNDSIQFVINRKDTLPMLLGVVTNGSGCTNSYLTAYIKDDGTNIFLKNMPSFNAAAKLAGLTEDSLVVSMRVNQDFFELEGIPKLNKFIGLNYDRVNRRLSYLEAERCFQCR